MRPPSPWEGYLLRCAELAKDADRIYIGTYGVWTAYDSSPLVLFLTHLNGCVKCPKQIIVGYNHRQPEDCAKFQREIKAYGDISWKYLSSFHSKYFLVRRGRQIEGLVGSFNLSDTAYTNMFAKLHSLQATAAYMQHHNCWRRARKTLPTRKVRRKISVASVMESTDMAADTGYQPVSIFTQQLIQLEEK